MKKQIRYSPEVRERPVRMVLEQQNERTSQWAAIQSISGKFGCTHETLRRWRFDPYTAHQSITWLELLEQASLSFRHRPTSPENQ